jgi:hypothetical protein
MFYSQCNNCNERWELGTASTCKCPDEEPVKFAFKENNDSKEVLRVTLEGEFIWHPDADNLIAEGDFSQSPALPHILRALRKQRTWIPLTDEEFLKACQLAEDGNYLVAFQRIQQWLKEKNK